MLTTEEQDAILKSARALARRHLEVKRRLLAMGLWPKALPLQNLSTGDDFELTRKNRT